MNTDLNKVLLINPPWYRLFGEESLYSPLGLCYIGGVLEKHGFDVAIYNADFKTGTGFMSDVKLTQNYDKYLYNIKNIDGPIWKEIEFVLSKQSPDIVGISVPTAKYGSALNVSKLVKKLNPEIPVVWGGVHPTILPEEAIKNYDVDIIVRGEGENTFLDLVENIETLNKVLGITYKENGKIIHNPNRPLIENLDEIPFPARHLIIDKEKFPPEAFGNIFASRGCPYNCIFCASHLVWTKRVRYRSPQNVVEEIKQIKDIFKTHRFRFEDDSFTLNKKFVENVCNLLLQQKIDIQWITETRANLVEDRLIETMKQAGCDEILIGVESGDVEILKKIKKGVTIEQMRNAKKILKENKMKFSAFFMIGFPWETKKEIDNTVSLMKELDPHQAIFSAATPYPGTELYEICRTEGIIPEKTDWSVFFHQSPDMFLCKNLKIKEYQKIMKETEMLFEKHNNKKQRNLFISHPSYIIIRFIKNKYYTPKVLWPLFKRYILN